MFVLLLLQCRVNDVCLVDHCFKVGRVPSEIPNPSVAVASAGPLIYVEPFVGPLFKFGCSNRKIGQTPLVKCCLQDLGRCSCSFRRIGAIGWLSTLSSCALVHPTSALV